MRQRLSAAAASTKTKIGSVAIRSEARPELIRCSAQCSAPCPPRKNSAPMMTLACSCARVGRNFFQKHQSSRMLPATRCRNPAVYSGGIVSTA